MSNNNTPNTETISTLQQTTNYNPDGSVLGQSTSDKIAFYGKIPYTQKSSSNQAIASSGASSSASFWGAQSVNATSWTAQKFATTAASATGTSFDSANFNSVIKVFAEVVDTLVALGLMKGQA